MVACPRCRAPLPDRSLATLCMDCLNAIYLERIRERECEALGKDPNPMLEVARVRGDRQQHAVLRADRDFCYCGARPIGPKKNWVGMRLRQLPDSICGACRAELAKLQNRAVSGP